MGIFFQDLEFEKIQGPSEVRPAWVWLEGTWMSCTRWAAIWTSPKMSYGVLECYVTELHAYDFVLEHRVIKRGVICARPYI